jgi:hypothetical protein
MCCIKSACFGLLCRAQVLYALSRYSSGMAPIQMMPSCDIHLSGGTPSWGSFTIATRQGVPALLQLFRRQRQARSQARLSWLGIPLFPARGASLRKACQAVDPIRLQVLKFFLGSLQPALGLCRRGCSMRRLIIFFRVRCIYLERLRRNDNSQSKKHRLPNARPVLR